MNTPIGHTPEGRIRALGFSLTEISPPAASYTSLRVSGGLAFLSGHGPLQDGKVLLTGKVGRDFTVDEASKAAKLTVLSMLASLSAAIGGLNRVSGVVKLLVFVNATEEFSEHHLVADGASELILQAFGERGVHARSAIGVQSLPFGIPTEIEAVFEIQ